VHEDVERRERVGERVAVELPEERGAVPERLLHRLARRPVAADDEADAVDPGQGAEPVHVLLRCQTADVADEHLVVRRQPRAQRPDARPGAARGVEAGAVHATAPQAEARDAVPGEVGHRGGRGCERDVGAVVHPADPAPRRGCERAEVVAAGEAGDVGLEDRDARHAEPRGGRDRAGAEHERRGEVHDVRAEAGQRRPQARRRDADRELPVRHRRDRDDPSPGELRGRRSRADHDRLVAAPLQVLQHPAHAGRDAVERRQERLRHHGHAQHHGRQGPGPG
jgi:hypothetical protein